MQLKMFFYQQEIKELLVFACLSVFICLFQKENFIHAIVENSVRVELSPFEYSTIQIFRDEVEGKPRSEGASNSKGERE
jgi:hypothetical protein